MLALLRQYQDSCTFMSEIHSARRLRGTKKEEDGTDGPPTVQRKSGLGELIQRYWEHGGPLPSAR